MRFTLGAGSRRTMTFGAVALGAFALTAGSASASPVLTPTTTTLTPSPTSVLEGDVFTLTATVNNPAVTGTVRFNTSNVALPGCAAVPVVNGVATCPVTAGNTFDYRYYAADYSGDSTFSPSNGGEWVGTYLRAQIAAAATPNVVLQRAPIVYKATVTVFSPGSVGDGELLPATYDFGNVAFFVDGQPVEGCSAQPVANTGIATCPKAAPAVKGTHTLTTTFLGVNGAGPNSATAPFEVQGPVVTVSGGGFGSVTVGDTAARTVTLTNDGNAPLVIGTLALADGPFSIVGRTCTDATLAPAATCAIELAYHPTAAGSHTASLTINHNAGDGVTAVALTGTAIAPTPPAAPTTTTPVKGGTLAPGAKTTLTVTVPSDSKAGASSVPTLALPLSCPANEECQLNGKLTIDTSALVGKTARAAAAATETQTVAKFSKVQVKAGGLKTIKLTLSKAFIRSAQKKGIRRIHATLTINTVLGSGLKTTTKQQLTILIPKPAKPKVAKKAAQVKPKFTG